VPKLIASPLGKNSDYRSRYDPSLLFSLPRKDKREKLGVTEPLPFQGADIWNAYEVSWLNEKGKPHVAVCTFFIPCVSPYIIESKSLKLYLNSLNQTTFASLHEVRDTITKDLSKATQSSVSVEIPSPTRFSEEKNASICLDHLDVVCNEYQVNPKLLKTSDKFVEETFHTHLLKSNCPVTDQPDWATLYVRYKGPKIIASTFLQYVISYRLHNDFHEQCIERIFIDLLRECTTEALTVFGKYTRRGGVDINPFRSNFERLPTQFERTFRQ